MITRFKGDYRFLSNFSSSFVRLDGILYPTVEHAYQAAKTDDLKLRRQIQNAETPGEAKELGNQIPLRPHWEFLKTEIMADLLIQKFFEPHLRSKLLATGEEELIEGNAHGDRFWGVCKGEGQNKLGQLLMAVRQLYRIIDGDEKYEKSLSERLIDLMIPA